MAPIRCPTDTSLSMTRPSIWWKVCSWLASVVSWRKTLPGTMARNGGSRRSMARTCTGLVWVRRSRVAFEPGASQ